MRMSDWSSDVCSSDLRVRTQQRFALAVSAIAPVVERAPRSRECIVYVFAIGGAALPQRIAGRRIEAVERCTVAVAPAAIDEQLACRLHVSPLHCICSRVSWACPVHSWKLPPAALQGADRQSTRLNS